jgi:hypothetical protein
MMPNSTRDTCVFIAFIWLADVAADVAKSGHPFWTLAIVFLLLLAGFHYVEDIMLDEEEEEDEGSIPVKISTLDDLFASADYQTAQVTTVSSNDMKRLRQEYEEETEDEG